MTKSEETFEIKIKRADKTINFLSFLILLYIGYATIMYFEFFPAEYRSIYGILNRVLTPIIFLIGFYFGGKYFARYYYSSEKRDN